MQNSYALIKNSEDACAHYHVCVLFKNIKLFDLNDTITDKNISTRIIKQINLEKYRCFI